MTVLVVDASVLATALGDDGDDGRLARLRMSDEVLAAPDLIYVEVGSVWRRQLQMGELTSRRAEAAIADLSNLPLKAVPHARLLTRSWELRDNLTLYDAQYVALATLLGCTLLTADLRLSRAPLVGCRIEVLLAT